MDNRGSPRSPTRCTPSNGTSSSNTDWRSPNPTGILGIFVCGPTYPIQSDLLWRDDPAERLAIALQLEPTPEHRIVAGLAGMAADGPMLASAINLDHHVDLIGPAPDEGGPELVVEKSGDPFGEGPRQYGEARFAADSTRDLRRSNSDQCVR